MHSRQSFLIVGNETWKKKSPWTCFHVIIGRYDASEIYEYVGLYIQSNLENIISKTHFGLYRDDGLIHFFKES